MIYLKKEGKLILFTNKNIINFFKKKINIYE